MSPELAKAELAMINATGLNTTDQSLEHVRRAVDAILAYLIQQEQAKERLQQEVPL